MYDGGVYVFTLALCCSSLLSSVCVYKEVAGVSSMGEVSKEAGGQGVRDESALFKGPSRGQTEKWRI